MPSTVKTKGIILKIKDTPGKDKLVYILTPTGLVKAFMTPKRNAGKKSYAVDLFTCGEVIMFVTDSGNYLVNSITPEQNFYKLREEMSTLYGASYFASLAIFVSEDVDTDTGFLYNLLTGALSALCNGKDIKRIKSAFEFCISSVIGQAPCLEAESKANAYYFALEDGRLHLADGPDRMYMPRPAVMCIYKILQADCDSVFNTDIPEEYVDTLFSAAQQYIIYHTECNFEALRILNGVI